MEALAVEILVDDGDPGADRAGLKHFIRSAQDQMIAAAPAAQRVERINLKCVRYAVSCSRKGSGPRNGSELTAAIMLSPLGNRSRTVRVRSL